MARGFWGWLAAAVTTVLSVGCSPARAQDEQSFAAAMIRDLKASNPGVKIVPQADPLTVKVTGDGRDEGTFNFHRIYAYCRQATPADCAEVRDEFLTNLLVAPVEPTPASLRLAVRDQEYVDSVRAAIKDGGAGKMIIAEPIGEDLFAVLASDSPRTVTLATPDMLKKLGLTKAEAWRRAWSQTRAKLPALPTRDQLGRGAVAYQDQEYVASLLIDAAGWRQLADAAGPDLFVTVVADNFVFVGSMPDGDRLTAFKQTVREDCAGQPRCVSPNLYRFRDGRWIVSR